MMTKSFFTLMKENINHKVHVKIHKSCLLQITICTKNTFDNPALVLSIFDNPALLIPAYLVI